MSYQPINLGTPNNNDGDSLYAGGFKINANFLELYTSLAGTSAGSIKIQVGSATPGSSNMLVWSNADGKFVPGVNDSIRTDGPLATSAFFITDNSGVSGSVDQDLTSDANAAVLRIDGRDLMLIRTRNHSGTSSNVRGSLDINLGNANVTNLSVYTTSVIVRGVNGLEIYKTSGEDSIASVTKLLDTIDSSNTGLMLYETPRLSFTSMLTSVRNGTDSSNALAHTGFVKLLLGQYAFSSTTVRGVRGIIATSSDLTAGVVFNIDGIYHPKHCEGLIYNYNISSNLVTLVTGAAAHWSYSTSGVAGLLPTSAIAIVASYTPIIRQFTAGWIPGYRTNGTTPAVIDSTISTNTWYYLYYLGCLQQHTDATTGQTFYPGSSNVVISSNRDIESVDSQLRNAGYGPAGPNGYWQVVRRLGPVRTNSDATPKLVPFNVKRIDHGAFEYYWGLNPSGPAVVGGADTSYTTLAPTVKIVSSSLAITLADYSSLTLPLVPPIPGVTAHLTVRHRPAATLPLLYMYGEAWTVNSSISTLSPPFEVLRSTTTGITCLHNIQLPMSPDGCYIPDGTYNGAGILSVMSNAGQTIRYITVGPADEGPKALVTSTLLQFTVTGFRLAR